MSRIQVVIPLAGDNDQDFFTHGIDTAKALIRNKTLKSVLEVSMSSISLDREDIDVFFVLRKGPTGDQIEKEASLLIPGSSFFRVEEKTRGALETCYSLTSTLKEYHHLLIFLPDIFIEEKVALSLIPADCDGWIHCFRSSSSKHSYLKVEGSRVTSAHEKEVVSDVATSGLYYFRSVRDFNEAALFEIKNNRFYICPSYNFLISSCKTVLFSLGSVMKLGSFKDLVNNHDLIEVRQSTRSF